MSGTRSELFKYAFALIAIVFSGTALRAQETPSYYLAGQVHPRFQVTLSVNGAIVKTIEPKLAKAKLFLMRIDAELLRPGANGGAAALNDPFAVAE